MKNGLEFARSVARGVPRAVLTFAAVVFGVSLASVLTLSGARVAAQSSTRQFELGPPPDLADGGLGSMRGLRVPQPQDNGSGGDSLSTYIASVPAAVALGKALFWDQSIGSDGIACASCHFHAGADHRVKNALDPDLRGVPAGQFNPSSPTASGNVGGSNYALTLADFPFHQLSDPLDRNSAVLFDTTDIAGSQGVFATEFTSSAVRKPLDSCVPVPDPNFMVGAVQTRRVEPRNTPTAIGAAFNFRNFWDGRANNRFNGASPFGRRDASAGAWKADKTGKLTKVPVDLSNSSLASQAVGPPGSDFEMSCGGRNFAQIGHKVVNMQPLANQFVDVYDSVLGKYRTSKGYGLSGNYTALITAAFQPAWWSSNKYVVLDPANPTTSTFTQMEANFALFFGLAIQEYEKTLLPDHTRWDDFVASPLVQNAIAQAKATSQPIDLSACVNTTDPATGVVTAPCGFSDAELHGLAIFEGDGIDARRAAAPDGHCSRCHDGPEFSHAATHQQAMFVVGGNVERMTMGDFDIALYDSGFYNIGVTPTPRDLGLGALDPFGNPLSFVGEAKNVLKASGQVLNCSNLSNQLVVSPDPIIVSCASFVEPGWVWSTFRDAADGSFKAPTLRNIALTGPYFHNGSRATLEQVIEFYNRGGDRQGSLSSDTSGFAGNATNADPDIDLLGLSNADEAALVAFLKTLTDSRVANEQAPFDHPSLRVTNGHVGDNYAVVDRGDGSGRAADEYLALPAVGAGGRPAKGLPPLKGFLQ